MSLTLTSGTRVREPEFSPSECLELAKKIGEADSIYWHSGDREPGWSIPRKYRDLIVAALRAYADA